MTPVYFSKPDEFRKWLEKNHQTEKELVVRFYKVATQKPCMTWSESVDEALCFGWIDSIRRTYDAESYTNRFTPRNPKSNWSAVNIKKVEELIRIGKMTPAGLTAFEKRSEAKSAIYSYENRPEKLNSELEAHFVKNTNAWDYFNLQPPSYRKTMNYWIMSARQEATKLSRLEKLIQASSEMKRLR